MSSTTCNIKDDDYNNNNNNNNNAADNNIDCVFGVCYTWFDPSSFCQFALIFWMFFSLYRYFGGFICVYDPNNTPTMNAGSLQRGNTNIIVKMDFHIPSIVDQHQTRENVK